MLQTNHCNGRNAPFALVDYDYFVLDIPFDPGDIYGTVILCHFLRTTLGVNEHDIQ